MSKDGSLSSFIHLRVHSSYSLAEGAIVPKDMVALCKKHKMPAVAITDSGNMFGSLEFSLAASGEGIQPIIGCIVAIDINPKEQKIHGTPVFDRILLIAKNEIGYANLLEIVSKTYLDTQGEAKPHIHIDALKAKSDGIIVLTGGVKGPIGRLLLEKQSKEAEAVLLSLHEAFGDRLYIELMRHGDEQEDKIEQAQIDLAYKHNIPLVATNDVYFAGSNMHMAHDALLCIADGSYLSEKNRRKVSPECYFKTTRQMKELFADIPEAIENTNIIARRCSVMSKTHEPMLPSFPCEEGRNEADELRAMAHAGLKVRLGIDDETPDEYKKYFDRLDFELDVIIDMKFPGYFLIVSDFMKWSKANDIPVGPGRGSGAGSVVAWSLQITDLDPLRFGLLFERFLNPERVSMPDFDIDFCQERREEVIRYVQKKYGHDKVAQIITFGKLQAKAVIRDVGRVLQMPYGQLDKISKMIPFNPIDPVTLSKAIAMDRVLQKMQKEEKDIAQLLDIGLKLEGLNRHASTHAAGVVIGDRPLYKLVPIYRDPRSDMPVSGYSMKYSESAGLVKFDFLGLKTLTVISKACKFIAKRGVDIDIAKIPIDDKKTFQMLSAGDSVGVFQLESAGMRDTLRKLRPDNIDDIIALISLYRPGPMDNIPSYIARKHGTEEPDYLDPMLEDVLKETHGVIIYQEQVMQIAQVMGGYSLGGADLLRRAMGKKIAAEMDKQRQVFVEGAIANKVDKAKASGIFDLVAKFAGYGFNKSHAAAYAMISYQTGYLKANYPVEFMAASMNLEINDTDKINIFRQEVVSQKIQILMPDINQSLPYFTPETAKNGDFAIRFGLGALKNVGIAAMEQVQREREENGDYKDIFDFSARVGFAVNKRQLEHLVKSGAFDLLHDNRKQIYEQIETILRYGAVVLEEKNSSQSNLFGNAGEDAMAKPALPKLEDWDEKERLTGGFEAVGFYLGKHPLTAYKAILEKLKVTSSADMEGFSDGNHLIKIAGVVTSKKIRSSPRGRFATINLSDAKGMYEVSIFNEDLLSDAQDLLENGSMLLINAEARKDDGGVRLITNDLEYLEEAVDNYSVSVKIFLENASETDKIKDVIGENGKGRSKVVINIKQSGYDVEIILPGVYPVGISGLPQLQALESVKEVLSA